MALPQLILSCKMEMMTHDLCTSEGHSEEGIQILLPTKPCRWPQLGQHSEQIA